jgi:hypothetical protein
LSRANHIQLPPLTTLCKLKRFTCICCLG